MYLVETFALFGVNPEAIAQAGLWLIAFIVFAESGLLVGFFLPGDTLLVAAGVLAAAGSLPIGWTIVVIALAAIIGDNLGYHIGRYTGPKLFKKKDGILFRHEYVEQAQAFYDKHGGKTVAMAQFIPIVRTFAPMVAGIGKMDRRKFVLYNTTGVLAWAITLPLLGYWIGSQIPEIGKYLEYALLAVVVISLAPAIYHIVSNKKSRQKVKSYFSKLAVKKS